MDISIVLPIHNEESNLEPLLKEIEQTLSPLNLEFEVVAVDDASEDGSLALLKRLHEKKNYLKVISLRPRSGQTAALDAGLQMTKGRWIVTMDSDGQNDPHDIPKLLEKLNEGFDAVCGWRKNRKDAFLIRKVPSRIANFLIRKITRTRLRDLGCSMKMFDGSLRGKLRLYGEMHRFLGILIENQGLRMAEIEVNHRPRVQGQSKYNLNRTFKVLLDVITVWFMKSYRTKPIYVFGGVGIALLFTASLGFCFVLYQKFGLGAWVHKNPLFILSTLFVILGVQFIGLGILAEIVIRTYFESQDKAAYNIAEVMDGHFRPSIHLTSHANA